ncbi:hypothetical protein RF11_15257 [Thelohanellus kitauei]|uniref:Uncharacterized protein n=1 Tax=Thelohanellus kitauei TaxID=669202 RepID=A0A0C2MI63_THEKT|nr:hypothetical protein RF11_15257 [Thelohanellus kitauei]
MLKRLYSKTNLVKTKKHCFDIITIIFDYLVSYNDSPTLKLKFLYVDNIEVLINSVMTDPFKIIDEGITTLILWFHKLLTCLKIQPDHHIINLFQGFLSNPLFCTFRTPFSFYLGELGQTSQNGAKGCGPLPQEYRISINK